MKNDRTRCLVASALFLALALVLPFLTGQIPEIGNMLCPMHIPVLLAGFFCGWPWGLAVGFIAPLLRSLLFGMPVMFPGAAAMALELACYGAVSGFLYALLPKKKASIYISLIAAMILGRLVWGAARFAFAFFGAQAFGLAAFWAGAFTSAVPGILLQLILVPLLVMAVHKSRFAAKA